MTNKHQAQRKKWLKLVLACSIAGLLSAGVAAALLDGPADRDAAQPGSTTLQSNRAGSGNMQPDRQNRPRYLRTEHRYQTPDIILVDQYGNPIRLPDLLDSDEPVLMQFVFTTCTTICPVLSAAFASAQSTLTGMGQRYRMVTVSIDPEYDTPETLRHFAARFKAGSRWHLLTGPQPAIKTVLKAFDAHYPGNNKMYHLPYTYLRAGRDTPWLRLDGLLSTADLVAEYRALLAP